jgi:hypothetical protein
MRTGNIQPQLDWEEHMTASGQGGKKVYNLDSAGNIINFTSINATVYQGGTWNANVTVSNVVNSLATVLNSQATVSALLAGYRSSDSTYQPLRLDQSTNSIQTLDYLHHEVHAGNYYRSGMNYSLANGEVATYAVVTPDSSTWAHMSWELSASADGTFTVLENVSNLSGGATLTPLNHNRNSTTTSDMACTRGMTGDDLITPTGGTPILNATLPTGKGSVLSRDLGQEFILKQNSTYLFRYTNGTSANVIQLVLEWYEHENII